MYIKPEIKEMTDQARLDDFTYSGKQFAQTFLLSWPRYCLYDADTAHRTETEFIGRWQ